MKGRNIGRGVSIWINHIRGEQSLHDEVDAYFAPSECHALVARGETYRNRIVRRHIKSVTGLSFRAFKREVRRRTSARCAHFTCCI
jgi:hypothetical protein